MEYKIVKGIPLPAFAGRGKYGFDKMEIGDCMIIPAGSEGAKVHQSGSTTRASVAVSTYGRRHGKKFASRKQGNGDVYVWRLK